MSCNCYTCPHQKQIEELRRRCLKCNPDTTGGTPHGRVKADEYTLSRPRPIDYSMEPSGPATMLPEDIEHKLRMAMSTLFGLDPVDLLLIQHLMRGCSLESFGGRALDTLRRLPDQKLSRMWAAGRKRRILRTFPAMSTVLRTDRVNDMTNGLWHPPKGTSRENKA